MSDPSATPLSVRRADFPDGFVFAAATSAYQIEGHRFGGAGETHWDSFARIPGKVANGEDGAVACNHYHRWAEDLDLLKAGNFDGYRFSTSWARIQPNGVKVNPEGLDFYDRLIDGMLARGIQPMATLYHWELPSALARKGGWRNRDTAKRFADFTELVARRLGDRLTSVAPLNEPWCIAWLSHYHGAHAPGEQSLQAGVEAMHHVALAHGLSAEVLHGMGQPGIGAACNFEYVLPASETAADIRAAEVYEGIYNRWFAQAMTQGSYPEDVLEGFLPHMPAGWEADLELIQQPLDWFGVNYYTCQRISAGDGTWPYRTTRPGPLPKTDMGWEIHPDGLRHILTWLAKTYTGETPLVITENGMAHAEDPAQPDTARIAYYDAHLSACLDAIAQGAPLKGYTAWSLLDNFEWAFGYGKRFGLVGVDYATGERTPKASFQALAQAFQRD